ncbi:hypothetical protein LTR37_018132 [Vermiconidia calcicola]|uniref:Uncharacterized protein n=1 Tax=Vermiconidia calcicola TaxID=1690605 RepID=A0ACC3MI31_9PEZI|nr:hypothetical protein LTR37_018132 [Vermiconidia calcicola]
MTYTPDDSTPSISVTRASVDGTKTNLRVHSYFGESTPSTKPDNVRFAHPTVKSVRPRTPSVFDMLMDTDDSKSIASYQTSDDPSTSKTSLVDEDGNATSPLRPKNIWRNSGHEVTFNQFKDKLDGHKRHSVVGYPVTEYEAAEYRSPAYRAPEYQATDYPVAPVTPVTEKRKTITSDRAPSLQYIPRIAAINLDDPVLPAQPAQSSSVQKNRKNAYEMLDSGDGYVLAVMPKDDLPASAVTVLSKDYPSTLKPNQLPPSLAPARPSARPFSFPSSITKEQKYTAFAPMQATLDSGNAANASSAAPERKVQIAADADVQVDFDRSKLKTPNFDDMIQHKSNYARVESGIFDDAVIPDLNPTPAAAPPSKKIFKSDGTFLESSTLPRTPDVSSTKLPKMSGALPSPEASASRPEPSTLQSVMKHNFVSTPNVRATKPLPTTPAAAPRLRPDTPAPTRPAMRKRDSTVPAPTKMNDNGYPVVNPVDASRFSTTAAYQRRSMNEVEAKYIREQARKNKTAPPPSDKKTEKLELKKAEVEQKKEAAPTDKKTLKLEKKKAELEKKIAKQQAKLVEQQTKQAKKQAKRDGNPANYVRQQKMMDEELKRLMH